MVERYFKNLSTIVFLSYRAKPKGKERHAITGNAKKKVFFFVIPLICINFADKQNGQQQNRIYL